MAPPASPASPQATEEKKKRHAIRRFFAILGPGLVTGAADDDPSGIATYSQTGARFGYSQLWTVLFLYPLMVAVQEACARIGAVTQKGIARVVKEHYGKRLLFTTIALIAIANTINIGADIGAMAEATRLIIPAPFFVVTLFFTLLTLFLEIFIPYRQYAKVLKWLTISLLVYPVTMLLVHEPWGTLLKATFLPRIEWNIAFLFLLTGVIGTTISPYMFFWQASEEVEEGFEKGRNVDQEGFRHFIRHMRIDNAVGMMLSQIVTWCIIVVGGTVLHANGVTTINSAADAAGALGPLVATFPNAGFLAECIFAIGIVGLGLLAVPVLAGSAAYALAEAFGWQEGLSYKLKEAYGFYGVITCATVLGLLINLVGIDPIRALIITSVVNAVVAIPLIFVIIRISSRRDIMGEYASGTLSKTFLWITFIAMALAALSMFVQM